MISPRLAWALALTSAASCMREDGVSPSSSSTTSGTTAASSSSSADATSSGADATLATASTGDDPATSSSGAEPECGNGILEPGEHCDLEEVAGAPCPRNCIFEPGFVLWETVFDGHGGRSPLSGSDRPYGIDVSMDGVFVVGDLGTPDYGYDALIAKLSPSGELLWVVGHVVDPVAAVGGYHANDVSLDGSTMLIAGDTFNRPWVGRYEIDDGAPIWEEIFEEIPAEGDWYIAGSVSASSDGRVALLGYANLGYEQPGFIAFHEESGSLLDVP